MKRVLRSIRGMCKWHKAIRDITKIWISPLPPKSKYLLPCRLNYIENGQEKHRDVVQIKDAVMVLLYNKSRNKLVFVRQFRAAVYHGVMMGNKLKVPEGEVDLQKFSPDLGVTLELCAGLVDKDMSLEEIAREEVLEECGYNVDAASMQLVYKYRSGVGTSSGGLILFYCEVCDEQKVSEGGGVNDELIEVVELSINQVKQMVKTCSSFNGSPSVFVGILWFLANFKFKNAAKV
ncbi:uridine diphosphate glucose pyrophosphatase NUDT14-like [Drosophila tropicalis]|uniref:uridine diphosphate glucose pyrophosphatase NUDT14-like n=1 Tax=Drosophila tropicalis TaxID=46794 RepID=UPI0035ABBE4C